MPGGVTVHAAGLSLEGGHGPVYRDVGLDAPAGSLTALAGQAGSGRTSLLLTLAGRMRPTSGVLTVAGQSRPRAIRRVAALGLVDGVNDLERSLTVREHVHERSRGLFWNARNRARAAAALERAGLDLSPDDRTLVRALGREQRVRLGVALALLDGPGLLVLDNVDAGLPGDRRDALWATLEDLAAQGLTVVAACTESPLPRTLRLGGPGLPEPAEPVEPSGPAELPEAVGLLEAAEPLSAVRIPEAAELPEPTGPTAPSAVEDPEHPEDPGDPVRTGTAPDPGDTGARDRDGSGDAPGEEGRR
ncbi:multidrug ABC transporter ATPase-like protein [Planomonospora sphaerica]|uniref:Multidrug ABC transporter ATPase-like protein n=1 Tax=Planomonospora sphaerica TaxID=161355 RepID=A0A171BLR2_9ACTN|nr:ATP-binding cassette domain-containing protein [Planomonospora sphaerica]GAT65289.1 multidrug ABC transporter ATPase-like protein [Planomonospora sphaerica]